MAVFSYLLIAKISAGKPSNAYQAKILEAICFYNDLDNLVMSPLNNMSEDLLIG